MEVIIPSCPFYERPDEDAPLISECLFGESIRVLDKDDSWVYGKLLTDEYEGWTKKKYLGQSNYKNYRIINTRSTLHTLPNLKSKVIYFLPLGSLLNATKLNEKWASVSYVFQDKSYIGYTPYSHIKKINEYITDWVAIAEELIGTPYRWGGRNSFGMDCSALVQLCLQTAGEFIPRDTNMQQDIDYPSIEDARELKRGMLVFWDGHVAIAVNEKNIIHANAYHMKTFIEPLEDANKRIKEEYGNIKKILDPNKKK